MLVAAVMVAPDEIQQLFARINPAGIPRAVQQQVEFFRRQPDRPPFSTTERRSAAIVVSPARTIAVPSAPPFVTALTRRKIAFTGATTSSTLNGFVR